MIHAIDQTNKTRARELVRAYACQVVLCQDAVARRLNLTASDMKCYNIINCYGAMSPGELARRSGFTTGGITRIIDHLEAQGSVRRRPQAADRRAMIIEPLSPRTTDQQKDSEVDFDSTITAMVERYNAEEFAVIEDFLEHGADLLQVMTEKLQTEYKVQKEEAHYASN